MSKRTKDSGGGCIMGFIYLAIIIFIVSNWHIIAICLAILLFAYFISLISKINIKPRKQNSQKIIYDYKVESNEKNHEDVNIDRFAEICNYQIEREEQMKEYKKYYNISDKQEKEKREDSKEKDNKEKYSYDDIYNYAVECNAYVARQEKINRFSPKREEKMEEKEETGNNPFDI